MGLEKQRLPSEIPSPPPAHDCSNDDSLPSEPTIDTAGLPRQYDRNDLEIEATRTLLEHVPSSGDLTTIMRECNIRVLTHRLRSLKRRLFLEQVMHAMGQAEQSLCDIHCQAPVSISDPDNMTSTTSLNTGSTEFPSTRDKQSATPSPKDMAPSSKDKEFCIPLVSGSQPKTINQITTHAA